MTRRTVMSKASKEPALTITELGICIRALRDHLADVEGYAADGQDAAAHRRRIDEIRSALRKMTALFAESLP